MLLTFALIFLFGYIGYRVFSFLHIPGGAVTGALITLAIITSQGVEWAEIPSYVSTFFQVIVGIVIGSKFSKDKLSTIKSLIAPGLISSVWMILFSLAVGLLLSKFTGIELGSALYGSVPGGLSEMGLIALAFNLSVPIVTVFQFVRMLSVNLSLPIIAAKCNHTVTVEPNCQSVAAIAENKNGNNGVSIFNISITLLLGVIGGFTARYLGLPVGGMLGAMFTIGIMRVVGAPLKDLPGWMIICAQIILGGYLGTTFTPEMVATLQTLLLPILVFSMVIVLNGIFIGFVIHRMLGWDLVTSLLATAAGGVTIMTITALELNADPVKVSIFHALRLAIILLTMPTIIAYILG